MVLCCAQAPAQKHDTLQTVKVTAKKDLNPAEQTIPVQSLNKETLQKLNSNSLADAVKHFAGVNVKDYGGIGGLKTVSIRSLGANHTGVLYDGLMLGDAQGGQTDLGKFSLENAEEVRLYTGNITEILSPARSFSTASLLTVKTSSGDFNQKEKIKLQAAVKQGSFGLIQPSFATSFLIGKKFRNGINGEYQSAKGDYLFPSYENKDSLIRRNNTDIKALRLEYDAAWKFSDSNTIQLKAYHYESKRGLPGSVVLFNGSTALQRFNDRNDFVQSRWQKTSGKNRMLVSAKYSKDYTYYLDPAYLNVFHKLENEFHQQEIYGSAVFSHAFTHELSLALAADYFNNQLKRTDMFAAGFAEPNRNSFLENIAVQFKRKRIEADANMLYTVINEKNAIGAAGRNIHQLTPAVSVSVRPFSSYSWRIRAFYKKIFRVPTFNDLYYTNIGNTNLRPEYADLFNLGLTYNKKSDRFISDINITADGYYSKVKDRIIAAPRLDAAQWSTQNIPRVDIHGADLAIHLRSKLIRKTRFNLDAAYAYQSAADISDKNSSLYKTQLPYTPAHSGSAGIGAVYGSFSANWNTLFSSYRYRQGIQNHDNLLQGWNTNDINISYSFSGKENMSYRIIGEANNIFNTRYEIIKFYPMPGFNYRIGIIVTFKK